MQNLVENNNLIALTLDPIADNLTLLHHVTKIGKSSKKKSTKKTEKVAALNGFGSVASISGSKSPEDLFDTKNIVSVEIPSQDDFKTFKDPSDLKNLTLVKDIVKNLEMLSCYLIFLQVLSFKCPQETHRLKHLLCQ